MQAGVKRRRPSWGLCPGLTGVAMAVALTVSLLAAPVSALERRVVQVAQRLPQDINGLDIQQHELSRGDTFLGLLFDAGATREQAYAVLEAFDEVADPSRFRAGESVTAIFSDGGTFLGVAYTPEPERLVTALRPDRETAFTSRAGAVSVERELVLVEGRIDSSLYSTARAAGLPWSVMENLTDALSWQVDLRQDLRQGDAFAVLYERFRTAEGERIRRGDIVFAELEVAGDPIRLVRYTGPNGHPDFYDLEGQSARNLLRRHPIDSRIVSGYGVRRHPVTGERAMHEGLDYAGAPGTPVKAAGHGTVVRRSRLGAYGRVIDIRHTDRYTTRYTHLSAYASGLNVGDTVAQGEMIGRIGATGRVTGPHLHYEVLVNGQAVDPLDADLPAGRNLDGQALADFRDHRDELLGVYVAESDRVEQQVAQLAD